MKRKIFFSTNVFYIELDDRVILYNVYDYYSRLVMNKEVVKLFMAMSADSDVDKILNNIEYSGEINFSNVIDELLERNYLTSDEENGKIIIYNKSDIFIHSASIRITDACNLKCLHCFPDSEKFKPKFTIENIYKIIDQLSMFNVIHLTITGGEPFLVENILDFVKYANLKGIIVTICTNEMLIKDDQYVQLSNCAINMIKVSLDSMKKENHEFYKGEKTFDSAVNAISKLRSNNVPVCINTCISKKNIDDAYEMVDFAISKDVNEIAFDFLRNVGRGRNMFNEYTLDIQEKNRFNEFEKNYVTDKIYIGSKLTTYIVSDVLTVDDFKLACNTCKGTIIILANGDVSPCFLLYDMGHISGNLQSSELESIVKNDVAFKLVNNTYKEDIIKCSSCKHISSCFKMCRGLVITDLKDFLLDPSDLQCRL